MMSDSNPHVAMIEAGQQPVIMNGVPFNANDQKWYCACNTHCKVTTLSLFICVQGGALKIGWVCIVLNIVHLIGGIAGVVVGTGAPNILGAIACIIVGVLVVLAVKRERGVLVLPAMIILVCRSFSHTVRRR